MARRETTAQSQLAPTGRAAAVARPDYPHPCQGIWIDPEPPDAIETDIA
jgi:hypothetical protein